MEAALRHEAHHAEEHQLSFWRRYVFSTDHKIIAIQYLTTSFIMALIGMGMSVLMRMQLGWPGATTLDPGRFNALVTLHGTIMVFFVLTTALTGGFGNFLIPLQVGARDMAFPWLNMLSYWLFPPAILVLLASFFVPGGPAASGWTAYPPLSALPEADRGSGWGQTLWLLSMGLLILSFMLGSLNYITTALNMRTRGMAMSRVPLSTWAILTAAIISLLSFPPLLAAAIMLLFDRLGGTSFFVPAVVVAGKLVDHRGGDPLLWQHLFWFLGHPEVYILVLPAMGMVSDIIATHARKPIFGYKMMVGAIASIAFLSFLVWGHHLYTTGMNPMLGTAFMATTVIIGVPSAVKTFNWLTTLWGGRLHFRTALLFAIGFLSLFVAGGLTGLYLASAPVDTYLHETYFVVGHFHLVMGAASLFGIFAGIYHWFPKMFGRMLDERLGRWHFWLTFLGIYAIFFPMYWLGTHGMLRRIYETSRYTFMEGLQPVNTFISVAAIITALAQLIFIYNIARSLVAGEKAGRNPWQATTLEWVAPSPPPHLNWGPELPVVHRWAYDYSVPGASADFIPQTQPVHQPQGEPGGERQVGRHPGAESGRERRAAAQE